MRWPAILAVVALSFTPIATAAQPKQPQPAPPASTPAADGAKVAEAKEHFTRGLALLEQKAWDPALAEFLKSRELFPRASSTESAAICLRELRRYDEALEMYEKVLSEFSDVDAEAKARSTRALNELRNLVGTVVISGAEGASVSIDGRERPGGSVRVSTGTHTVRAYKAGYAPFETRVEVAGQQSVPVAVRLQPLGTFGRVRIAEQAGKTVDVIVDNAPVGKTPWEGDLSPGPHLIVLRGEGTNGSQPVSVNVAVGQVTPLTIKAEELAAVLRVEPTPAGAALAIDSVSVGLGVWEGRLRAGEHQVEVTADGFLRSSQAVTLRSGDSQTINVRLERDLSGGDKYHPLVFELVGGLALAPSLGGDAAKGASQALGIGPLVQAHAAFQTRFGLMLGLTGGYAFISSKVSGEKTTILPVGEPPHPVTATDERHLRGVLVGATAGWRVGEAVPLTLRLGGGAFVGSLADKRTGSGASFDVAPQATAPGLTYGFVSPEARIGYRFAGHFEATAGVEALVLFGSAPLWDPAKVGQVNITGLGLASYPKKTLAGGAIFLVVPTLGIRYDL